MNKRKTDLGDLYLLIAYASLVFGFAIQAFPASAAGAPSPAQLGPARVSASVAELRSHRGTIVLYLFAGDELTILERGAPFERAGCSEWVLVDLVPRDGWMCADALSR